MSVKYAVYSATLVKGNFKKLSDFYKTSEEAIEVMNRFYPSRTKVMEISKDGRKVIAYHKNCYK